MYFSKWFSNLDEAKVFQKQHGGALYRNEPRSRTKRDHITAAQMFGFDAEKFRYSVNWSAPKAETEI